MKLQHYIICGLVGWGFPGFFVAGPSALYIALIASLPLWLSTLVPTAPYRSPPPPSIQTYAICASIVLSYVAVDALFGRRNFSNNMFLTDSALEQVVQAANEQISRGRGVIELLGALLVFQAFALVDLARRTAGVARVALIVVAGISAFYEVGISRGYLLMAVLALLLGGQQRKGKVAVGLLMALMAFTLASFVRGDFDELTFSNPLFDAAAYPYINLAFLLEQDCGSDTPLAFLAEFLKKFVPAFVYDKDIFSFNIEMSGCIYSAFAKYAEAVSVFTYLGEMYYYSPSLVTAFIAGSLLALLSWESERRLLSLSLPSARIFSGLMAIVLLRSRVLDVLSFLILLIAFTMLWRVLLRGRLSEAGFRPRNSMATNRPN